MHLIEIESTDDPRLAPYARLTEAQLRTATADGIFIAESPKVIKVALEAGLQPVSLLTERRHIEGDAAGIISLMPADTPVFTGERRILADLTGYTLTRGVLCAMRRPAPAEPQTLLRSARRVAVLHGVCDTTNVGAIFRSAAALGIDAVLLSGAACDPLNRRAVRTSMGTVFMIPWATVTTPILPTLAAAGFKSVALALTHRSVSITDPVLAAEERLALILGTEGDGLPDEIIEAADYTARIPMARPVDSLNVAAAAAVAFWQLRINC